MLDTPMQTGQPNGVRSSDWLDAGHISRISVSLRTTSLELRKNILLLQEKQAT